MPMQLKPSEIYPNEQLRVLINEPSLTDVFMQFLFWHSISMQKNK